MRGAYSSSSISSQSYKLVPVFAFLLLIVVAAHGQYTKPRIFFTDLPSAPTTGGLNNQGAFLSIYGNGFGATRGTSTVTIGGVPVARYALWSDSRIVIQPGSSVVSGNLVVNVSGAASTAVPFTVRTGRIFFVSLSGRDTQKGTYAKPWQTILKAKNSMAAGDITYVMDGVTQSSDSNNAALSIGSSGGSSTPKAIIAYPGAKVTIGSSTGNYYGVQSSGYSNWILSGLTIRGAVEALDVASGSNWRVVGNDMSCPAGHGAAACLSISSSQSVEVLGNYVHEAGNPAAGDRSSYNSVAFSGVKIVDVGWNRVANTGGCRAVSFSSATSNQYGLAIHNNLISSVPCDGINLQGTDASLGKVQVFDNVVYRAANACVSIGGSGLGTAQILNNTFYDCGSAGTADSGGLAASTPVSVIDNLFYVTSGENYVTPNTSASWLSGSNNGGSFAGMQNSMNADPLFVNPAALDFHLQSVSPAINAGIDSGVTADGDGVPRPQGAQYDIGAFEYTGAPASGSVQLTESPSTLDFGSVAIGSTSTLSVTITNSGGASATLLQMNTTGTGFSASGPTLPLTLSPGQSMSFTVTFAPQTSGPVTGSVSVVANSSGSTTSSTSSVQLSGTAVQLAGTLSASPSSLSFGSITVGSSSSQTVTVTASTGNVTISQATTRPSFSVSGPALPVTLSAGQSASFSVKFAPTIAGSISGSLSLISDATNTPITVSLAGTGVSPAGTLSASSTSLSFGNAVVGSSSSQTVTVTASTGNVTISQATATPSFSVSGPALPVTLSAGQSASFSVKFAPAVAGNVSGSLSLVSNATNTPTAISLAGTGVSPAGTLSANPTLLSFGSVTVGSSSSQTVTVTASTASVTISQATAAGTGFSVSGPTLPVTLATGQSALFSVKFAPAVAGSVSGSLSLVSSAANTPTTVSVSGNGAIVHSVTLTWTASTSTGVVVYNAYRGTQSGGPYTKITATPVGATTYTDSSIVAGATYYYVVTAVDNSGTESSYSSEVSATAPIP